MLKIQDGVISLNRGDDVRIGVQLTDEAGNAYTMQVLYRMGFRWTPTSTDYVERFIEALEGLGFFDEDVD